MPRPWESASAGVSRVDLLELVTAFRPRLLPPQDPPQVLFYRSRSETSIRARRHGIHSLDRSRRRCECQTRLSQQRHQQGVQCARLVLYGLNSSGGLHILMIGPPSTGKTLLAKRLPTILPPLTPAESLETTGIYSAMGRLLTGQVELPSRHEARACRGRPGQQTSAQNSPANASSSRLMDGCAVQIC
jgi:hypothetical protein